MFLLGWFTPQKASYTDSPLTVIPTAKVERRGPDSAVRNHCVQYLTSYT